jgi:hypothetical protein
LQVVNLGPPAAVHFSQLFAHTHNLLLSVDSKLFLAVKLGLNRLQELRT